MTIARIISALMFAAAGAVAVIPSRAASEPAEAGLVQDAPRVRALLKELSADPWQRRARAQEALVEMGDGAIPAVEQYLAGDIDDEARVRGEEVLRRLRWNLDFGPTMVSLELNDAMPADAFDELARAAKLDPGFKFLPRGPARPLMPIVPGIPDRSPAGRPVSVRFDRAPFWTAFRELSAKSGMQLSRIDESGALALRGGDSMWAFRPASSSGPFMLSAVRIDPAAAFAGGRMRGGRNLYTLSLLAFAEPKLKPISWSILRINTCVTDTGQSFIDLNRPEFGRPVTGALNSEVPTRLTLMAPPEPGQRIAKLELAARFVLEARAEQLEVSDVLDARDQTIPVGGLRFRISDFTKHNDWRYTCSFSVTRDGRSDAEWDALCGLMGRILPKILDEEGKGLLLTNSSATANRRDFTRSFEVRTETPGGLGTGGVRAGPPAKLIWRLPVETRQVDATFEFNDLLLP